MKSRFLLLTAALLCSFMMLGADPIQKRIKSFTAESYWTRHPNRTEITRAHLVQALEKSRNYYLNSQREEGNFVYSIDLETGRISKRDNPVRQAGALWGLACLNRDRFNEPTRQAVIKGIQFFFKNIQHGAKPSGGQFSGQGALLYNRPAGDVHDDRMVFQQ